MPAREKPTSVRLEGPLKAALEKEAVRQDRTLAGLIRLALREWAEGRGLVKPWDDVSPGDP